MKSDLGQYLPRVYDGILETDELVATENASFYEVAGQLERFKNNQYVLTAEEDGIEAFELLLEIAANPAVESLEFRRARLMNRFATLPPITTRFLRNKLNEIIGADKYSLQIDNKAYKIILKSSATDQLWAEEIYITINRLKPANMIYINIPRVSSDLLLSEMISSKGLQRARFGSMRFGVTPWATISERGVVKLPEIRSLHDLLLSYTAENIAGVIQKVVLNGTYEITEFLRKEAEGNICYVEYPVFPEWGGGAVTSIKLLDENDELLTSAAVYIPVINEINIEHQIKAREGA